MENNNKKDHFTICVFVPMPKESSFEKLQMSVRISTDNFKIIWFNYNCPTRGCEDIVKSLLIGYSLDNGIENMDKIIEEKVSCPYKDCMVSAINRVFKRYQKLRNNNKKQLAT